VVKALEGLVGELDFEVVAQAALRREGEERGDLPEQPPERAGSSKLGSEERGDQRANLRRQIGLLYANGAGAGRMDPVYSTHGETPIGIAA
jgi:hypothetical protein